MKIKANAPKDFVWVFSRDFSFFSSFTFSEEIVRKMQKYIGVEYHQCYFTHRHGQVDFYRSKEDERAFNTYVGERSLADETYLGTICDNVRRYTDLVRDFLQENKELDARNVDRFLRLHEEYLPWHMAVYWAGEYIGGLVGTPHTKAVIARLNEAWLYNELVLPEFERWLLPQGIVSLLTTDELLAYLKNKKLPEAQITSDRNDFAFVYADKEKTYLSAGAAARRDFDAVSVAVNLPLAADFTGVLEGTGISKGTYTGKVQKIELPNEFPSFRSGSVLVTKMTRPHYNPMLRSAGAIVTDEGAFLSHAAVLAREFGIPTVIGTKIATQVFNDGDLVEVDAEKGTVKKLS